MVKPATATLSTAVVEEIVRGVNVLRQLARPSTDDPLAKFRSAFQDRYQGQAVPLVEALDEELGIGFESVGGTSAEASALLDGLTFPKIEEKTVPWGKREDGLLRKLTEALARGEREIVLRAEDLEEMAAAEPAPLPDAFAVMASVAAPSAAAAGRGDFRLALHGVSGPSGAILLGRFCHADPELCGHVRDHLRVEESFQPDAIFAEIVHLPEGRVGNILARPVLREYEIPYLGKPTVPPERQIPVTDLLVSVVGDQVVLRSARLGRRVIPRLTSAHNFAPSQGIYKFLCLVQAQGTRRWAFDWGPLSTAAFLPRVVVGRVVLARAHWNVSQEEVRDLARTDGAGTRFRAVQVWRDRRRLPRFVSLSEGDNELLVDLDNVLSTETFLELANGKERVQLVEMLPGPDELCACGPEGRFTHELIVPFVRHDDTPAPTLRRASGTRSVSRRVAFSHRGSHNENRRFPRLEWLYAKLYCGTMMADQVLRDVVRPVTESALGSGRPTAGSSSGTPTPTRTSASGFTGTGAAPERGAAALQAAAAPLMDCGSVWKFQLDTYERRSSATAEPHGVEIAEQLFQADSEAALAIVEQFPRTPCGRAGVTLWGMDLLLSDLGLDLTGKLAVLKRARDNFAKEFRADAKLKRELGDKYRQARQSLETLLDSSRNGRDPLAPGVAALRRRSERTAAVTANLRAEERAGRLSLPVLELAPSYLHMHANRMLRSAQRMHEVVLYDFLYRCCDSRASRQRMSGAVAPAAGPLLPERSVRTGSH